MKKYQVNCINDNKYQNDKFTPENAFGRGEEKELYLVSIFDKEIQKKVMTQATNTKDTLMQLEEELNWN